MTETSTPAPLGDDLAAIGQPLKEAADHFAKAMENLALSFSGNQGSKLSDSSPFTTLPEDMLTRMFEALGGVATHAFGGQGGLFGGLVGNADGAEDTNGTGDTGGATAKESADEIGKAEKDRTAKQAAQSDERVAADKKEWAAKLANAVAGSAKLQKVHRAMSIATTVMDTAKGISAALSGPPNGPPWPLNIAQAALVAAQGAKSLSSIKGVAHEGLSDVPTTGTYLLERGERVVDSRLNADLKTYLTERTDRGAGLSSVTNAPSVNLTINGSPDPDAVSANRGALESMIRDIFADHALQAPFD